jgi:hypothetical protein
LYEKTVDSRTGLPDKISRVFTRGFPGCGMGFSGTAVYVLDDRVNDLPMSAFLFTQLAAKPAGRSPFAVVSFSDARRSIFI